MKLFELNIISPSDFDRKGKPMKLPNVYTDKDVGKRTKVSAQTVTVKSSGTGQVYGRRTIMQKD